MDKWFENSRELSTHHLRTVTKEIQKYLTPDQMFDKVFMVCKATSSVVSKVP